MHGERLPEGSQAPRYPCGTKPPSPEWRVMLRDGRELLRVAPWVTTFPGLAIMISVMGINLLGDGLRDVLDPRLRV